jgi:hypothetical protein
MSRSDCDSLESRCRACVCVYSRAAGSSGMQSFDALDAARCHAAMGSESCNENLQPACILAGAICARIAWHLEALAASERLPQTRRSPLRSTDDATFEFMTEEFDLLKSLNITVSAAPTPSRGSKAPSSVDWDARSQSSLASSLVSLSIDKLSGAVVDRMVAHAREASPRHSLEIFKGGSFHLQKQHDASSVDGSACSDVWSVSGPASAAPSVASHVSNKCRVPPPTLKHSHASSSAHSVAGREASEIQGPATIVLQPSYALRASGRDLSSAAFNAPTSASSSTAASIAVQASVAPESANDLPDSFSQISRPSSAHSSAAPRPYTAHGTNPLSIVVGHGERQPNISGQKVQQQKYAQDLAHQIQVKSSIHASAARKSEPLSTSLHFQPSEFFQQPSHPRERCPFQMSKQVRAALCACDRFL